MSATTVLLKAGFCRSVVALPAFVLATTVEAQQSSSGPLEEILVTAQKREESLQDATIAVTAIPGEDISNFAVKDINHLANQMPSVQFMTSGLTNTTIRGVGTYNNQPNVDAAVAWVIDGTYISHHMAVPPILFDVERVEVVRGPLGTLYGKNSNGGAISILTARPVLEEFHARASVGAGNYDALDTEFMVNVPVNDSIALRASLATDDSDGYFEDGGEGTDNYAARVRLLVEPSDNFDLLATIEVSDVDGSGVGIGFCPPTVTGIVAACNGVQWKPYQGLGLPGNFRATGTAGPIGENPGFTARRNTSSYVEWNYRGESTTLTSITNYHKYDREELHTWDFNSYSPIHENEFVTQEFRLASSGDSRIEWVTGLFYSKEFSDGIERFGTTAGADHKTFVMNNYYGVLNGEVTTQAVFGDVGIPISDRFRIRLGARYTDEEKSLPGEAGTGFIAGTPVIVKTGSTLTESKPTWSVGFEYDAGQDHLLYAKINTGFKSGTVNAIPPTVTVVRAATDPEEVTAIQIGTKNYLRDGRIRLNAEIFDYDYEGYQVVVIAQDPSGFFPGNFFPSVNAQKASFTGGEIETTFAIGENGQLDTALTLLDAVHDEFVTPAFNFSGRDVQRAPDHTLLVGYRHQWNLSGGGSLQGRISTMLVDAHYTRDGNLPGDFQDDYSNTSAYVTYSPANGRWSVTGWGRNLEDEDVVNVAQGTNGRPGWNVFMMAPRMYGVTFKYEM
jgi:iron complex outermembrane receptor protein